MVDALLGVGIGVLWMLIVVGGCVLSDILEGRQG